MYNGNTPGSCGSKSRKTGKRAGMVMLSFLILLTFTVGGSLAYLAANTDPLKNIFTPSEVTCEVTEDFTDGKIKKNVNVINTGDTDAWLRIKLVSYWMNDQDQIIGGTAEIPAFTPGEGWVFNDGYYYYTSPVAPMDETNTGKPATDLISSIELKVKTETITTTDDEGDPKEQTVIVEKQVIEVIAEAIQAKPEQAVRDAWGFVPGE